MKFKKVINRRRKEIMICQSGLISILLVVLAIGGGCGIAASYDPFKIAQNEFYNKIRTIALAPVEVPDEMEIPESVRTKFESLIEAKLREAGFSTVPSNKLREIFKQITEQVGSFFDPKTGKRDKSKFKIDREEFLRQISTKFNADAILYPSIEAIWAPYSMNWARWDGTGESVGQAPASILVAGNSGKIRALSLVVTIQDRNSVDIYINRGGIQLLAKFVRMHFGAGGYKVVDVLRGELFANEEQNVAAVNIALGLIVNKPMLSDAFKAKP